MRKKAFWGSYTFFLIIGLAYLWGSLRLEMGTLEAPRSGLFPSLAALLLIGVSIALLVKSGMERYRPEESESFPRGADLRRVAALILTLAAYAACLKALGYLICTTGLMAATVRLLGLRSWRKVVLVAALTGLLSYGLFVYALDVPLPRGEVLP